MKNIVVIFTFLFFVACNRKAENPKVKTIAKDSIIIFNNRYYFASFGCSRKD